MLKPGPFCVLIKPEAEIVAPVSIANVPEIIVNVLPFGLRFPPVFI
ncbi:MAG: hypothetical protein IPG02_05515 [Ignavibacteria bacterium]|nr:hypothetical protein [Ignavibacteria bacterium]